MLDIIIFNYYNKFAPIQVHKYNSGREIMIQKPLINAPILELTKMVRAKKADGKSRPLFQYSVFPKR